MAQAAREIEKVMKLWLDSARRHGDEVPEPDLAREEIDRVSPFSTSRSSPRTPGSTSTRSRASCGGRVRSRSGDAGHSESAGAGVVGGGLACGMASPSRAVEIG